MTDIDLSGVNPEALRAAQLADRRPPSWSPPTVLPPAWDVAVASKDGARYISEALGLSAILSCSIEDDGRPWLHLSVCHRARIPTWHELRESKGIFLGDREAYQVLPPQARYINIHPHVLHLFALLDGSTVALPDFTRGTGSL